MRHTEVVIYQERDGTVPLLTWMDSLPAKVQDKLLARIELLADHGFELRRPHVDTLRDGVHELRAKNFRVNYRILYFFHGKVAVLARGLTKEDTVPDREIDLVVQQHSSFAKDPEGHTYREK